MVILLFLPKKYVFSQNITKHMHGLRNQYHLYLIASFTAVLVVSWLLLVRECPGENRALSGPLIFSELLLTMKAWGKNTLSEFGCDGCATYSTMLTIP